MNGLNNPDSAHRSFLLPVAIALLLTMNRTLAVESLLFLRLALLRVPRSGEIRQPTTSFSGRTASKGTRAESFASLCRFGIAVRVNPVNNNPLHLTPLCNKFYLLLS